MKISEIQLETDRLAEVKRFYQTVLELPLIRESRRSVVFAAGRSRLAFTEASAGETPFYHFAFNIPENQLDDARTWLSARVPLLERDGEQVFHFESWDAHAVYFRDPVGNIVEFIARHTLGNASSEPFSAQSLESISEIGVPVENVRLFAEHIKQEFGEGLYDGDEVKFAAVGDAHGMFVVVPIGRPWFPTDIAAEYFPTVVDVADGK